MQFQYSPYMLPLIGAALISGWVAVYVWQRRAAPGAVALSMMALAIMVWSLGYALEIAGADLPTKEFWGKVQYLGIVTAPLMWLIFAYHHANRSKRIAYPVMVLLAIVPVITLVLVVTSGPQGPIWQELHIETHGNFSSLGSTRGFWFWVLSAYSYLLLLAGALFIFRSIGRLPGMYRGQTLILLIAVLAPWAANILYLAHLSPIPNLDLTPFAFALSMMAFVWGILGYQLLDLLPIARDAVVDEMADGMIIFDARNRVADINPAAQRMIGLTASQAIGRMATEVLSPWSDLIERFGSVMEAQEEITAGEGETRRWYELRLSSLKDRRQRVTGRVVTLRNISERKRAEKALHASEERFRWLFATSPDAILLIDPHDSVAWPIVDCNEAACQMNGYPREELIGQSIDLLNLKPGTREIRAAYLDRLHHEGVVHVEAVHRHKDGHQFPVDVLTSLLAVEGQELVMGIDRDITERKRAEQELRQAKEELELRVAERTAELRNANENLQIELAERKQAEAALRESEERFRTLYENSTLGLYRTTPDGRILLANPALVEMIGYTSFEELSARNLQDDGFEPNYERTQFLEAIEQAGEVKGTESIWMRRDGTNMFVRESARAIRDQHSKTLYYDGTVEDITERKRMEIQLREQVATLQALAEIDREIIAATESRSVLELVCRRAAELVHAPKSTIVTGTAAHEMEMTASYGFRDAASANVEFAQAWHTGLINFDALNTREVLVLNEIAATNPFTSAMLASENVQALAIASLTVGGRTLGALIVVDTTVRQWPAADLQVLSLLASQAAVALEKLRLFETARSRALHLATLNEIGQAITSSLDLDRVLRTLLDKLREAMGTESCSVALIDEVFGDVVFRQAVGPTSEAIIGLRLKAGQGLVGWVAAHQQTALVTDAASDPRFFRDIDGRTGFVTRDLMVAPLIIHNRVVGVIELVNKQRGTFGEEDVSLLESVAAQAAIAIENAQLFETERAGRQRLETLYEIGQTINSTLDVDSILDRLTDVAMRATHATRGAALVVSSDQAGFQRRSLRGYSPELAAKARMTLLPLDQGVNGQAYQTHQTVYLSDVTTDPLYFPLIADTRSELAVPILRSGQVLGNLDLQSPEVDAFQDVDMDFLQALTAQVAVALENARLFEETRRRLDEMAVVSNVALVGAAGRPFDETMSRATAALVRLWPNTSLGYLFVDEADQSLHLHSSYHALMPEVSIPSRVPPGRDIISRAVRERQPLRVADVQSDPRHIVNDSSVRSEMVAPLVVGERAIGVVNVVSPQPDAFSGDDLRLLTTLAGQLATIFEKVRLDAALEAERASLARRVEERTAELRAANEQLRQAHKEVNRALDKEKELGELKTRFITIASHEFRTPLTIILASAELLEYYRHKWTADKTVEHLHRIQAATHNMTVLLDDVLLVGKAEAGKLEFNPAPMNLDKFCRDTIEDLQLGPGAKHELVLTVEGDGTAADMDEKLLRHILSNLLSNAIKYSPPGSEVYLGLTCQAGQASLVIRDQGIGIPLADQARLFETFHRAGNVKNIPGTGLGLTIVKRSVDVHGGTIEVDSQLEVGTTFTITLPMRPR